MKNTTKCTLWLCASVAVVAACYALFAQSTNRTSASVNVSTASSNLQSPRSVTASRSQLSTQKAVSVTEKYSSAKNINDYITKLSAASSPPGTLELVKAKAWDECGSLITNPNSAISQIAEIQSHGGKYAEFRIKALQQVQMRCKDFAFSTQIKRGDAEAMYKRSASDGNAEAIARNLVNGISTMPAEEAKQGMLDIISSNDPDALFILADAFGSQGPFEMTPGGEVGTSTSTYAWQLVACDQGMDCSASSSIVQQSCLYLGLCGPGDYRTNIQYSAVSPADYQQITQIENHIENAMSNGTIKNYFNHK